ncbi:DEAD/DEAH box helicase [Bryobacter aggregatus]|uniref:DEAD/DEAH box helicase n=1 Tax=Bryobacter aggregatus TaxID=360054 RepID=UPI0004E104E1|nr:DEAD/DEAH box helicase [Bryobacter aggregatus]
MFDQQTIELIQSAPPLDGLSLNELPRDLTRAYSTIVSLRMRLRESLTDLDYASELGAIEKRLEAIALTHEAFVAVAADRPNRVAAAFVSGTAHQLRFSARKLIESSVGPSVLAFDSIAPEIAATILFLVAGRAADASQMARNIRFDESATVEDYVRRGIADLARGRLVNILERELAMEASVSMTEEVAVGLLWTELLRGIRALAALLLGRDDDLEFADAIPSEIFAEVRDISIDEVRFDGATQVLSVFPGPHHLASLLHNAASELMDAGVINIDPPPTIQQKAWRGFLKDIASCRPYLWPNHREAIAEGYLTPGISAVVSFPTGAGKSTLSELKIGAARLRGKKVVFLAPTLALVNQVFTDLRRTFPDANTTLADELEPEGLTNVAVMTPERCLTLLGFSPEAFKDVGLLVFDECHIMHPRDSSGRRSVDAMLCLLSFLRAAPDAEVLLVSAMIKNGKMLAEWLGELTNRPAISLALRWKPTRQARGCVVYPSDRIAELNLLIRKAARSSKARSIPRAIRRQLTVVPRGMISLLQTWQSEDDEDYAVLPLLGEPVCLDAVKTPYSSGAYLNPNRNDVAAAIGARSGDLGVKTLVFAQQVPWCTSIQDEAERIMQTRLITPTSAEIAFLEMAAIELGGEDHSYCRRHGLTACHHGSLLPAERQFNESMFRRPDGVHVMVATSTLAQGMNLPSQLVVLAGDDRFDQELNKMTLLDAHELLNAAGRAGRAGEAAEGLVVLVPGKVIEYDELKTALSKHWFDLREIFSNSDQCLELEDPLEPLLDQIHMATEHSKIHGDYLLKRLPIMIGEGEEVARRLLENSFGAFKKRLAGDPEWIQQRVDSAMVRRQTVVGITEELGWEDELAATTGILGADDVRSLAQRLMETVGEPLRSVSHWIDWGRDWLVENPEVLGEILRPLTVTGVFGSALENLQADPSKASAALVTIGEVLPMWIGGSPLKDIDQLLTNNKPTKKCRVGREWALRLAPELAYFFGIVTQTCRKMREVEYGTFDLPLAFTVHGRCVREGFDHPDKLALHHVMGAVVPRVVVHQRFKEIEEFLEPGPDSEKFPEAVSRVRRAWLRFNKQ